MADNKEILITRIPELAELLQKDGTLYVPVYKKESDTTYRILVDLLGGATDTTLQWSSNETYATGDIREWNLKLWKSKIDNNIGNVPAENANWTEVSKSEGSNSINYWNAGVYTINPTLTLYDNNLYLLDASQVSMPFESTDFLAEKTAGIWLQLTGNDIDSSLWEPELITSATTEHPRWDDSGDPNIYGTDKFGFGAVPGGRREHDTGVFQFLGEFFTVWTSTPYSADLSWVRIVLYNSSSHSRTNAYNNRGHSLRLVRPYAPSDGDKIDGRILSDTFTDGDGNTYDGVIIGDQVWSTTNLKTTSYADGTPIPTGYNDTDWSNLTTGAYAVYDHTLVTGIDSEAEMIAAYGLLYNWYAVDNAAGLSDDGAVPTDAQFTQLTDYIIATYPDIDATNIGDALKSIRQVNSPYIAESDEFVKIKNNALTNEKRYAKTENLVVRIQTKSADFDLVSGDEETYIRYTGATDITVTVPNTLKIGQPITLWQAGAGVMTLAGDTGVTLNGDLKTAGQNRGIQIMKVADNLIDVIGGVA